VTDPAPLFDLETLRAGLDSWLSGNAVMKRTFRNTAIIAGLIERSHQGRRKTGRQATFSSDILYDTLRKYDPDHLLLQITREEALRGLIDFSRIEAILARVGPHRHLSAARASPRWPPPCSFEPGRIPVQGEGRDRLAAAQAQSLMEAAGLA
jgi:ATP-dependent helicase Lhr and Lhr-like helicase